MAEFSEVKKHWIYSAKQMLDEAMVKTNEENFRIEQTNNFVGAIQVVDAMIWGRDLRTIRVPLTFLDAIKIKLMRISWIPTTWLFTKFPAKVKKIDLKEFYPLLPARGIEADKLRMSDIEKTEVTYNVMENTENWNEIE